MLRMAYLMTSDCALMIALVISDDIGLRSLSGMRAARSTRRRCALCFSSCKGGCAPKWPVRPPPPPPPLRREPLIASDCL